MRRADLDRSLIHGIAWTSAVTWFSQVLTWGSTFVVIGLLTPRDYGLVGLASVYFGLVRMTSELGLGAAIIQYRALTPDQIAQFNGLSVLAGLASVAISVVAAFPYAWYYDEPRLRLIIIVMSAVFLINAFGIVPRAVLQREMQFRKLAMLDGIHSIAGAATTLTLAILGFGYWTLVIGPIVSAVVFNILLLSQHAYPLRKPDLAAIREPFEFSKHTLLARFAWFGYSNSDTLVIGKVLSTSAVGAYNVGWSLAGLAVEKITALIGRVTPAFFSAVQNNLPEMRRYLLLITEGLALLTFPACIGLALVAADIVELFGPAWRAAIRPMQILAVVATLRSISPLVQQVSSALGDARVNVQNNVLAVCILPFAFYAGSTWGWSFGVQSEDMQTAIAGGITGVALGWLIVGPLLLGRQAGIALRRLEMSWSAYLGALWPATSACLMMTGAVLLVDWRMTGVHGVPSLAVKVATGAVMYVGTLFLVHRNRILAARKILTTLRSRGGASAPAAEVTPDTPPQG